MSLLGSVLRWLLRWWSSAGRELEIHYAPARDGDADPGEVVWTWVPFEDDPTQGKDRPVLVIGLRNGQRVGLALTSRDNGRTDQIEVGRGAWDGHAAVSFAKLDRLIELEGRPIRREGAALERQRFDAVVLAYRSWTPPMDRQPRR